GRAGGVSPLMTGVIRGLTPFARRIVSETAMADEPSETTAVTLPEAEEKKPEATEEKPEAVTETAEAGEEKKAEKLNQIVEIKDVGPCRKHIKVMVDRADIDKAYDEKYKELIGDAFVPGFRPGKAPRQIVIRKYRKEVGDQVKALVLMGSL